MAQFDVYRNYDPKSKERVPYLLDIQKDLFVELSTRLVIPIVSRGEALNRLNIEISVRNQKLLISTQEMTSIPSTLLGDKAFSLEDKADDILESVNFLLMGF